MNGQAMQIAMIANMPIVSRTVSARSLVRLRIVLSHPVSVQACDVVALGFPVALPLLGLFGFLVGLLPTHGFIQWHQAYEHRPEVVICHRFSPVSG